MSSTCAQEFVPTKLPLERGGDSIQGKFTPALKIHITLRELDVLRLVVYGHTAKRIGLMLKISNRTVEKYIENLKSKFNCHTKASLAYICLNDSHLRGEIFKQSA